MNNEATKRAPMAVPTTIPEPAVAPRLRPSRSLLGLTLALALSACLIGGVLAWHDPAPADAPTPAVPAPAVTAGPVPTPDGPHLTGRADAWDWPSGTLVFGVHGNELVYQLDANTVYPARCLGRSDLRPGRSLELILNWYLGGQAYAKSVAPAHGC